MMLYESFDLRIIVWGLKMVIFRVLGRFQVDLKILTFFASLRLTLAHAVFPHKPTAWPNQRSHLIEHALM